MKVMWKAGYSPANVSAQTAYDTIHELYEQGRSSAKDLVDASRPEDAPLHPLFTWDDQIAAEKYREREARTIIAHIICVPEEEEHQPTVRAFFKIEPENNAPYEPTFVIMKNEDKREMLLNQAKRELVAFEIKYQSLNELARVFEAIHEVTGAE